MRGVSCCAARYTAFASAHMSCEQLDNFADGFSLCAACAEPQISVLHHTHQTIIQDMTSISCIMVEMRTLPSKTIKYCFARGKNPVGVRLPLFCYKIINNGDEGSRTPVQNGLKQTSTSVDFHSLN